MKTPDLLFKNKKTKTDSKVGLPAKRRLDPLFCLPEKGKSLLTKQNMTVCYLLVLVFDGFLAASISSVMLGTHFSLLSFTESIYLPLYIAVFACTSLLLAGLSLLIKSMQPGHWSLLLLSIIFAGQMSAQKTNNLNFCIAIGIVVFIIMRYLTVEDRLQLSTIRFSWKASTICLSVTVLVFTCLIGAACIARYTDFGGATFDVGIFTQMFEFMRTTGLPDTTVERYELTSHFSVHFSPFFYLLLPGYAIWPHPSSLFIMQAAAVALCVFPIRRICKNLGLSAFASTGIALIWIFFPSNAYGCFNDFHENKFLPLCLLCMVSMLLEKNRFVFIPFALLALSVKEDAAIYVACVGLYWLFTQKDKCKGILLIVLSVGWFIFATQMIQYLGGEAMMSRFAAYQADGGNSLLGVIKTCFLNVGFLLKSILEENRINFILWMLLPVLFAPFLNKSMWTLILLVPMLVINLMPTWEPQHDILFQYTYGTAALLLFASIMTIKQMKPDTRRFFITTSLAISFVFCMGNTVQKAGYYFQRVTNNAENIERSEELLDMIPADASVTARDYVVPHLYDHKNLYTVPCFYGDDVATDYYVIDKRQDSSQYNKEMHEFVRTNGYELICDQGYLQLWQKTSEEAS